eukprot:758968-Hanusia_phi.AAC.2
MEEEKRRKPEERSGMGRTEGGWEVQQGGGRWIKQGVGLGRRCNNKLVRSIKHGLVCYPHLDRGRMALEDRGHAVELSFARSGTCLRGGRGEGKGGTWEDRRGGGRRRCFWLGEMGRMVEQAVRQAYRGCTTKGPPPPFHGIAKNLRDER